MESDGELRAGVFASHTRALTVEPRSTASASGRPHPGAVPARTSSQSPIEDRAAARGRTRGLSLRTKGVLAILVLIGYLAAIAVFLANERQGLVSIAQRIEANQNAAGLIDPLVKAMVRTLVASQQILNAQEGARIHPVSVSDFNADLERINIALEEVRAAFPAVADDVLRFRQAVGALKSAPAPHQLAQVRDTGQVLLAALQEVVHGLQQRSRDLNEELQARQELIGIAAITANVIGAVASVAVILVFFTRLARDINRLRDRASAIVAGYDGAPLPNRRRDEVGGLIDAVNTMQVDLRRGESQMELVRQQRFHQEKMAAVGSLASAIGHEVSNPIAAISGVAQFLVDESDADPKLRGTKVGEFAGQILRQTERIAHIMRQLTALTAPRTPDPELLDLNALVRSTAGFIRYDKRFRGVEFEETLEHDLPAVTAVADHLTQVLINLLINSADATADLPPPALRRIAIATRLVGDDVVLSVSDNGRGMTPDVLARAFDESFTTKPAGQGRGIGLFVCKNLVESGGGRIALASAASAGTTASVYIPLAQASAVS